MIKFENICKCFGTKDVLKDISIQIDKGETISIIGKSGTGKSTLLKCINMLQKPDKRQNYN